jgi:hypothetical protein
MLATRHANLQAIEPRSFNPRGRGGRFGRDAASGTCKRSSQEASLDEEDELMDSASSPLKQVPMETSVEDDLGAIKALNFDTATEKGLALTNP